MQDQGGSLSFDVFLSYSSRDKEHVRELKRWLLAAHLRVWLDESELRPGVPWQKLIQEGVSASRSIVVVVGPDGIGPWEDEEMQGALHFAVRDKRPIIPVLLPGCEAAPKLPMFLSNRTWVDLRPGINEQSLAALLWGITGVRPNEAPGQSNAGHASKPNMLARYIFIGLTSTAAIASAWIQWGSTNGHEKSVALPYDALLDQQLTELHDLTEDLFGGLALAAESDDPEDGAFGNFAQDYQAIDSRLRVARSRAESLWHSDIVNMLYQLQNSLTEIRSLHKQQTERTPAKEISLAVLESFRASIEQSFQAPIMLNLYSRRQTSDAIGD
jgi:hypothetical protein